MTYAVAFGAGWTSVQIDGNTYSNITDVHISSGGRVIMIFPGGVNLGQCGQGPAGFSRFMEYQSGGANQCRGR